VYGHDGWPDDIYCGTGYDEAYADEDDDWIADDCELIVF
jgi:hypothetical protein